jgi:hypothetical protein
MENGSWISTTIGKCVVIPLALTQEGNEVRDLSSLFLAASINPKVTR